MLEENGLNKVLNGDSLEVLKTIESESVDLLCTDPPYGYSFMGKSWDKTLPDIGIFKECFRVLKPGAFAFVMSAPRSDVCARMMLLLEDAGFNIGFTPIFWTYASGFPKAMNIGKMVDKRNGVQGEVIGTGKAGAGMNKVKGFGVNTTKGGEATTEWDVREVVSDLDGSYGGFQPKPAVEVIIVAMKPLSEKTFVDQALKNGKGITWLDDCRVPGAKEWGSGHINFAQQHTERDADAEAASFDRASKADEGRFPANLLVEDNVLGDHSRFFALPFLIVPKASKREKNEGLEHLPDTNANREGAALTHAEGRIASTKNAHPTVKPLTLMSYLITLGSRPGDVVLDPFLGSGTTALAAKQLGRQFIGIEREEEYVRIADARLFSVSPTLL